MNWSRTRTAVPRRFEPASDAIDEGLWRDPVGRRRLRHLLAVLIHAHEEPDVVTAEAPITGDAVGSHLFEGMAEVRVAVGVVDGSGKEERPHSAAGPLGWYFLRQRRLHPPATAATLGAEQPSGALASGASASGGWC